MFKTKPWELTDFYSELTDTKQFWSNKWFEGGQTGEGRIDVEGKNFVDVFLVAPSLDGTRFVSCDFTASRIVGGFLEESELVECIFNRSNLDSSKFNGALIKDCQIIATTYIRLGRFNNAKVEGCNFGQSDLCESRWNNSIVKNVNFEQANFPRSKFHGAKFINCNFRYANFFVADFKDATFENCDFRDANIDGAKIQNTTFNNCGFYGCLGTPAYRGICQITSPDISPEFDGSKVVEAKQIFSFWGLENQEPDEKNKYRLSDKPLLVIGKSQSPEWSALISRVKQRQQMDWVDNGCVGVNPIDLEGKNLSRAFFSGGYLDNSHLKQCDFTLADLRSAGLEKASVTQCNFDSAMLMDLKAAKAIFQDCTFRQLIADRSNFEETQLQGCDWTNSEIYKGIWYAVEAHSTSFTNTNWFKTNWYEGKFISCDFSNAELWKTVGEKAIFENCNFQNADFWEFEAKDAIFKNCDFRGANLRSLRMENTRFENCAFYSCQNIPYHNPKFDSVSQIIAPDLSANFDGSKIIEPKSVQEFCDLLKQQQEQQARLERVTTRLSQIKTERKRLDERIQNLSGGNYNPSLHSRIKELKANISKLIGEKSQLEREKADLESEIDLANL